MRTRGLQLVVAISFLLVLTGLAFAAKTELSEDAVRVADEISLRNMRATVSRLTALPTRVTGYEPGENAAKYIFDEFQRIGLEEVDSQEYEITVPVDHGDGKISILGSDGNSVIDELKLSCLWPNLVRTSFLPKGIKHKVKEEDTLEGIARSYGISVSKILDHEFNSYLKDQATDGRDNNSNGEIDEEGEMVLFRDKDILIPIEGITGRLIYASSSGLEDFNDKSVGGKWHVVQPDDTIDDIAHGYRVGVGSILDDVLNLHLDKTNDDIDNDNDGDIDEDGEMPLMEDIALWYDDGIDNDNDGNIDEIPGDDKDGIDNDRDGQIDEAGEFVEANESSIFVPQGAIVLLDFNCAMRWINAAMLGARAVIFIEPEDTIRGEAEAKFLTIPAAIPRFWISRDDADKLIKNYLSIKHTIQPGETLESISEQYGMLPERIRRSEYNRDIFQMADSAELPTDMEIYIPDEGASNEIMVQLSATMTWERKMGQNISGLLPGFDPELKGEMVVIQSYFDSMSIVPSKAPGADPTCGIASLLEVARVLSMEENRPGRTVLFLATSGHFQGLAGMRAFMYGVSEDLVRTMYELREDLYRELREIRQLGRRIVLAIGKGLLVELPPSFFERVQELEDELWALRTDTLPELNQMRSTIESLRNNKRDEIEKRKERRERTRKREEEKFTPEDQARLEALTARLTADAIQTAYHFDTLVNQLMELRNEAINKCREEEKTIIRNYALPLAKADIGAVKKLRDIHHELEEYSSFRPWIYGDRKGEEDPQVLIQALKETANNYGGEIVIENERDVDELVKQYSYGRIADRHLDSSEYLRLKKARKILWKRDKSVDYEALEIELLGKALSSVENRSKSDIDRINALLKKLSGLSKAEKIKKYTDEEIKLVGAHLSEDKVERLIELRKRTIDAKTDVEKYLAKEKDVLMLASYNARNASRLMTNLLALAKQVELTREYTVEEERILSVNLSEKEFEKIEHARKVIFSKYDETQLLDKIYSRALNDVADLESFITMLDTMERATTDQEKVLLRDNLPTLKNSRIGNIHKKIGILSRVDRDEYERKISLLMQIINLQDKFNRYYSSLFVSLDLSTQGSQLGLFGKGWFYDQQPEFVLRREFASIGNKCSEYANNASFGRNIHYLSRYTDDQIRQAAISGQWSAAASTRTVEAIEGKTLESLVADHYSTLISLGGVNRLMKLQFQDMKNRGEPSKEMLKDMDYLRKEVSRFIRTAIRDKRKARKSRMTLYRKLDEMLELKELKPEELTPEEAEDVSTLISLAGIGGGSNFVNAISATGGKTWRTYIPGKIAFDSEVATLAGKTGIAFATVNDARVLTDTPLDTLDRVNFDNLLEQTRMLSSILIQI
ncbi:LysM peptidoglycan-binding domain-containing protein, partial [Candidatus Poribacteria bacterium]|nr:LysM peptidoglycan-binding domain-containing protein [Candidatus Poribacteria bacterium]